MIKFDSKEDAIEVAIAQFDKHGIVEFNNAQSVVLEDIYNIMEEESASIHDIFRAIARGSIMEVTQKYESAYESAKVAVIEQMVNIWWAK
jgi:hypothetical protein